MIRWTLLVCAAFLTACGIDWRSDVEKMCDERGGHYYTTDDYRYAYVPSSGKYEAVWVELEHCDLPR